MEIYFDDRSEKNVPEELTAKIERVIMTGLERNKLKGNVEVSVSFTTPEEIRELNRDYRKKDAVTDVLSFASAEDILENPQKMSNGFPVILGDIVICTERAEQQADEYGHSFEREMCFLATHGLLHLLGYDHEAEDEERAMVAEQNEILNSLGIVK